MELFNARVLKGIKIAQDSLDQTYNIWIFMSSSTPISLREFLAQTWLSFCFFPDSLAHDFPLEWLEWNAPHSLRHLTHVWSPQPYISNITFICNI